jgi:hypothetical protein
MSNLFRARMAGWLLISLVLTIIIAITAPQQLLVSLYKLSLITSAAWVAYWIDRSLFPYARPDAFLDQQHPVGNNPELHIVKTELSAFGVAQLRRALIIAAAMIAVALGA